MRFQRIHDSGEIGHACLPALDDTHEDRKMMLEMFPEGRRFRVAQLDEIDPVRFEAAITR